MKKSPLSTPGCHTSNFHHQNRRRGGYGYNNHQSRNNSNDQFHRFSRSHNSPNNQFDNDYGYNNYQSRNNSNDQIHRFSRSNNSSNNQFDNEVIPLDSSSPVFYHKRGKRQMFDRRNQRFSNTGISGSDNYKNFQNNSDSPYQRHSNQFRQKNEPNWYRLLPITEFIDLKSMFENPWMELETKNASAEETNPLTTIDNATEIDLEKSEVEDTLSDSISEENSTDINNSHDEHKDGSSVDLQLDGMSFSRDSKNTSP